MVTVVIADWQLLAEKKNFFFFWIIFSKFSTTGIYDFSKKNNTTGVVNKEKGYIKFSSTAATGK